MDVKDERVERIVNETVQSVLDCVGDNESVSTKFPPSIQRAPSTLRNVSTSFFKPRVVSIGPLHHRDDEKLERFEVQKGAFVRDLLSGSESSPTQTLKTIVRTVASMIDKIRERYADMLPSFDDNKLAKMMVMDACFILQFIHVISLRFYMKLQEQHIAYDLVLLGNQIPFFVLEGIYECIIYKFRPRRPITEFILPLVKYINLFERRIHVGGANHDHILGYLHHCCRPRYYPFESRIIPSPISHSAAELDMAGVNFKPYQDPEWALAMKVKWNYFCFLSKPTLTMPKLRIDDFTELVFWNLIAYEQLHVVNPYVTSYARAMGMLINTHEDIATLVRSKVIVNGLGSNEEAANMISKICKEVVPEHFYYSGEWKQLDIHFKSYWARNIWKPYFKLKRSNFEFKKTYFSSPWSAIALFAGIALFVLTVIQTIFTVMSSKTK